MSLRTKAFRAIFWIALAKYMMMGMSLLTQLLLARLLAPEAFGLVGITVVVIGSLRVFQDLGLKQTLIAKNDIPDQALDATFFMSLAMGSVLFTVMLWLAPLVTVFFDNNQAITPLLRLLSVCLLISSLETVPSALLERELNFKTLAKPRLIGTLGFALTALPLAFAGFGAWSMVWGSVIRTLLQTTSVWLMTSWRPRLQFDRKITVELFSYSKYIISISLGTFLQSNIDSVIVGKTSGMTAVGYYNLAFALANALPLMLMNSIAPVLLPTYSQIQGQRERLANLHLRSVKYLLLVLVPLSLAVILLAKDGIMTFYGEEWQAAIVPLQILCIHALIRQVTATNGPILMVTNEVKKFNYLVYLYLGLILLFSWPVIRVWGIVGMSLLMTLLVSLTCLLTFWVNSQNLNVPLHHYTAQAILPLFAVTISALVVITLSSLLPLRIDSYSSEQFLTNVMIITTKGIIIVATYVGVIYMTDTDVKLELNKALSNVLRASTIKAFFHER